MYKKMQVTGTGILLSPKQQRTTKMTALSKHQRGMNLFHFLVILGYRSAILKMVMP